jgi:hypothetical protein
MVNRAIFEQSISRLLCAAECSGSRGIVTLLSLPALICGHKSPTHNVSGADHALASLRESNLTLAIMSRRSQSLPRSLLQDDDCG